jgi:hypothetical protein
MSRYIVELEPGGWIPWWKSLPRWTPVKRQSKKYRREQDAKAALTWFWKKYPHDFPHARIVEIEVEK